MIDSRFSTRKNVINNPGLYIVYNLLKIWIVYTSQRKKKALVKLEKKRNDNGELQQIHQHLILIENGKYFQRSPKGLQQV